MNTTTHYFTRMKPRTHKTHWWQTWSLGGHNGPIHVTLTRSLTAKTERVTVSIAIVNPHWEGGRLFPAASGVETNAQREVRLTGLVKSVRGQYKHGAISWHGRGANVTAGLQAARNTLQALGIIAVLPEPVPGAAR